MDKLPTMHKKIFQQHQNTMGERMCEEFLRFLNNFELSTDDPNYEAYTNGADDSGAPIKYYIKQASDMQQDEKSTLSVDYRHLSSF